MPHLGSYSTAKQSLGAWFQPLSQYGCNKSWMLLLDKSTNGLQPRGEKISASCLIRRHADKSAAMAIDRSKQCQEDGIAAVLLLMDS